MECKKCKNCATISLRKKDYYCENCFITNTIHKFRASIGKNKILKKNEKVLICLSGGLCSTVLLDLVYNSISTDSHKKLRINPSFLYLIDMETDSISQAEDVIELCKKYEFDLYIMHISQYMKEDLDLQTPNNIPSVDCVTKEQFSSLIRSLTTTTYNDFMTKIYRNMFIKCAKKLDCSFIFTGEITATLAVRLLSNLALGRGSQIEHDVGFCDGRNERIKIIRPIKDVSQEELVYYSEIKGLTCLKHYDLKANSLQTVIEVFVTDLQNNFPATISTCCKTADKIGHYYATDKIKCVICESDLGTQSSDLTALEVTKLSKTISQSRPEIEASSKEKSINLEIQENKKGCLFPHINEKLCYGCCRNNLEIDKQTRGYLPPSPSQITQG